MPEMTSRERLLTALKGGVPDRVPCFPSLIRWLRYHHGCTCPRHQLKLAEGFGFDLIVNYGQYVWQSVSDDYVYAPGGGYGHSACGLYGDLPDVNVELRIENREKHVWTHRSFHTPAGDLVYASDPVPAALVHGFGTAVPTFRCAQSGARD